MNEKTLRILGEGGGDLLTPIDLEAFHRASWDLRPEPPLDPGHHLVVVIGHERMGRPL